VRSLMQQPAPARASTAADIESARIDAQLELAAKKAALVAMQRQAGGGPASDGTEAAPTATVTYEKDGKTVTLTNPSQEQMQAITTAMQPQLLQGWMIVAMTGITCSTALVMTAVYLWHRRKTRGIAAAAAAPATDARLARIENAVESIAVEVERVSEAQRYATRLLSEGVAGRVDVIVPDAVPLVREVTPR
jgi:hypothetical protein